MINHSDFTEKSMNHLCDESRNKFIIQITVKKIKAIIG